MKKVFLLLLLTLILAQVVFLNNFFKPGSQLETTTAPIIPEIRSEVYGEAAPGEIYTTIVNTSEFDDSFPSSTPFLLKLSAEGNLLEAEKFSSSVFEYKKLDEDKYSFAQYFTGSDRWSSSWFVRDVDETHQLRSKNSDHTDFHFLLPTDRGYIVPAYPTKGPVSGQLIETSYIEEQSPEGEVLFQWDSLDYVPVSEAEFYETREYWLQNNLVDYFHLNSMSHTNDGHYLLSARNVNQVLKVNKDTGEIVWQLGGKSSDFEFVNDPFGGFSHQHSVNQLPNGNILVYDNGNLHKPSQTRVVEYELDEENMIATLVWSYQIDGRFTFATGSVQRLPGGHTLIGWGTEFGGMPSTTPRITELDENGEVVMNIYFPDGAGFYSAYKL